MLRDLQGRRKDGSLFPVEVSLSSMTLDGEEFVVGSVSDITVRKANENALRESETRLRLAMDAASAGTWAWDLSSNQNVWSDDLRKLYGLDKNGSEPSFDLWKSSIALENLESTLRALQKGVDQHTEFELTWRVRQTPKDNPRWLLARGRPVFDAVGNATKYIS